MILGFNKRFPQPILDGSKKHTIREDKHNRWKAGRIIHMATGVRTKNYNCFCKCKCTGTQSITIIHLGGWIQVFIDKRFFGEAYHHGLDDIHEYSTCLVELARNDGFSYLSEFFHWFNTDFEGKIIHWTDYRY